MVSAERLRLDEADTCGVPWRRWGPYLSERQWGTVREDYGLTNAEGNHGEDVKEYDFYLDATPTSSYLKMLYMYPQAEFPYADLPGRGWRFTDILSQHAFERKGAELASPGLFVDLGPWQFHLLAVR